VTATQTRRRRGTGHELREVVLRVATDLLAEHGDVDGLTKRAVATADGVTSPSVYRHFLDKETLVRTVVTERFAEFTDALRAAGKAPMARLEAMSRAYIHTGLVQPGHYRVLFSATNAGPAGLGLPADTGHPGAASHRLLVEAVAACLPPRGRGAALALATGLWASRITKPELPWPVPDALIDAAPAAVRAAAREPRESR
jgi:AcrR family transcriptional regulator